MQEEALLKGSRARRGIAWMVLLAGLLVAGSLATAAAVEPHTRNDPSADGGPAPPFRIVLPAVASDSSPTDDGQAAVQAAFLGGAAGRFQSPLAAFSAVTDRFGAPRGNGRVHGGIDLALGGYPASPVYSACDGTVLATAWDDGYGNFVLVDCGDGWSTLYGHLSAFTLRPGTVVSRGMQVGISGSTGVSTGEHLHFEVRKGGIPVDPELVIDFHIPPGTPLTSEAPLDDLSTLAEPPPVSTVVETTPEPTAWPKPEETATPTPPPTSTPTPTPTAAPSPAALSGPPLPTASASPVVMPTPTARPER